MTIRFRGLIGAIFSTLVMALAGCGGGSSGEPPQPGPIQPDANIAQITQQPADQSVAAGATVAFSVQAQGNGLAYQWQRSSDGGATWGDVTGATASVLTLSGVDVSMNGTRFRAVVSTGTQTLTSSAVLLTVSTQVEAPAISADPVAQSVYAGSDAVFSVTASGTAPSYRWQSSADGQTWSDLPGQTAATLRLTAVALSDNGLSLRVIVSNASGSVASRPAGLGVSPVPAVPVVTAQPEAASVVAPQSANFAVTVIGTPSPTYQWQSSTDGGTTYNNIASATARTYSTGATTTAMNGTWYRVVASNSAGTSTSAAALLTVSTAQVAPAITSQPQAATVTAPGTATFSVTATGNPAPSYQWQVSSDGGASFTNVNGATAASYVTPATTVADSGRRFRVVASNVQGSQTSGAATLTVNPPDSKLQGRAWTTAQSVESGDGWTSDTALRIDDQGFATLVFMKDTGTRLAMMATRGTPGATGQPPSWGSPVVIDVLNGTPVNNMGSGYYVFDLAVSPNGYAVVYWFYTAPCTSATYETFGDCRYLFTARFMAASGSWEAPVLVADVPDTSVAANINNAGDVALSIPGWERSGANSYIARPAVAWRANGQAGYSSRIFNDTTLRTTMLGMDAAGNMLLAAEASQNATVDIVAYHGTLASGFGSQQLLDTRGDAATLRTMTVGVGGQAVVLWSQNNGGGTTMYSASRVTAQDGFHVDDLGISPPSKQFWVTVSDTGTAYYFDIYQGLRLRWTGGTWDSAVYLPDWGYTSVDFFAANRNGDFVGVAGDVNFWAHSGLWVSYDADRNQFINAPAPQTPGVGYVLGVDTTNRDAGYNALALSTNGIAVLSLRNQYDVLPTPAAPAGDARNVKNAWALMLK